MWHRGSLSVLGMSVVSCNLTQLAVSLDLSWIAPVGSFRFPLHLRAIVKAQAPVGSFLAFQLSWIRSWSSSPGGVFSCSVSPVEVAFGPVGSLLGALLTWSEWGLCCFIENAEKFQWDSLVVSSSCIRPCGLVALCPAYLKRVGTLLFHWKRWKRFNGTV